MPAPDTEPENYSIDEMMDRLRSKGDGGRDSEPQLVTREDGTQVYRVKKRKRRSHQPKKVKEQKQKRFRIAQVIGAVVLVILVAVAFFASLIYLNSSGYRDASLAKVRTWTGAEPKVTQLRFTPVSINADAVEFTWPEESMLANLKLHAIQGRLNFASLLKGEWKGSELFSGQGGTLVLRPPGAKGYKPERPEGDSPFQFRSLRSTKFNVRMGDENAPAFSVRGTDASLELHEGIGHTSNFRLEGGILNVAGWGDFKLELASLRLEPQGMRIGTVRLAPSGANQGKVEISNPDNEPFVVGGDDARLRIKANGIALKDLLGPSFGSLLSSTVETPEDDSTGELRISTSDDRGVSWRIPFRAVAKADSVASGLPMFEIMAREMQESWYQQPRFDVEAKGTAVRDATSTGVENLILDARGRLSMSGKIIAKADGTLEGELQVGLPSSAVANGSPSMRQVFERKGGGFSWAKIRISGTTQAPADDLEAQLKSSTSITAPATGGSEALEDAFEQLITPEQR